MAVTGTITITTLLFFYVVRHHWRKPLWIVALGAGALLAVDLLFLAANLTKLVHGAWLPLLIAVVVVHGADDLAARPGARHRAARARRGIAARRSSTSSTRCSHRCSACRGTAVFLNRGKVTAPLAMRANVEHNRILHEHVVILSIETMPVPHVPTRRRGSSIDDLGYSDDGITHVTARFGYMDEPNVPDVVRLIREAEIESPLAADEVSYFLSTIELHRGDAPGMSRWRKRLFLATSRITADAAEYFRLPRDRTVIMGSRIEL